MLLASRFCLWPLLCFLCLNVAAQPVTGVWRGRVVRGTPPFATSFKVEVKVIRQGDSLTGTSYYYAGPSHYYRYAIRGYLDATDGSLHWWDDTLLERRGGSGLPASLNNQPLAMQTDFSCPGAGIMKLDGIAETKNGQEMEVHLDKQESPLFADGWDELISNWLYGGAHPDLIAEAEAAQRQGPVPAREPSPPPVMAKTDPPAPATPVPGNTAPGTGEKPAAPAPAAVAPPPQRALTVQEKMDTRRQVVQATLPLVGDSIELQFFDNAEIDGDSIALFLNGRLLFEHVKLSAEPFVLKLAVADLPSDASLSMVAENLGAIPPNTSFMMAFLNGQRYTARLESTEGTTAVIQFRKPGD